MKSFVVNRAAFSMAAILIAPNPKRKRGAQPNNLNGSKNAWLTFWRRRAVKEADRWIIPLIQEYATGLLHDKGDATQAERRTIEIAQLPGVSPCSYSRNVQNAA